MAELAEQGEAAGDGGGDMTEEQAREALLAVGGEGSEEE
jgi:hypothetical protein